MRRVVVAFAVLGCAVALQAFPPVSSDPNNVQLNVWHNNVAAAKAKAKALNRPALVAIVDSVTCSYCKKFDANILASPAWPSFLATNPMILIMVDRAQLPTGTWGTYTGPYRSPPYTGALSFPTIAVLHPNGALADLFLARNLLGANPGFYNRVKRTTDQYPNAPVPPAPVTAPGTIGFSASAVTVSEGAGTVTASVTRQGGGAGAQTFSYATENGTALAGTHYTAKSGTLTWGDGEVSTKTVSVQLVNDNRYATPASRSFALRLARVSGSATLGTSACTVTVTEVTPAPAPPPAVVPPAPGKDDVSGVYQGFFYREADQKVCGTLSLSAAAKGKLSAKAVFNGRSYSGKGAWSSGTYSARLTFRKGEILDLRVAAGHNLTGSFQGAVLRGRRFSEAGVAGFAGYYTACLGVTAAVPYSPAVDNRPEGAGYVTFAVNGRGSVKYSGALADGTKISGASLALVYAADDLTAMGYRGVAAGRAYACFPLYVPVYGRRGAVAAEVWLDGRQSPAQADNRVLITGSEWVYPGRSAKVRNDGFIAAFDGGPLTEAGAAFAATRNLATTFEGAGFVADGVRVPLRTSGISVALPLANDLDAELKASLTTGLFSGVFLLQSAEGTSRHVKFAGALVPALGIGRGYYEEPAVAPDGFRLTRSRGVSIAR